jgi:Copper transport outer membrane protein, MctB
LFDLRYHVASLAAVFLALAVGIILGVAISGKVRGAEDALNAQRVARIEAELERQQEAAQEDSTRLSALETYVERTYPTLIDGRLAEESTAVVLVGEVSDGLRTAIESTLRDAAGVSARVVSLDVPLDPGRLDDLLTSKEELAGFAGDDFGPLGEAIGEELVLGAGETPLLRELSAELVAELAGSTTPAVTGVVVARQWEQLATLEPAEREATQSFLDGLMRGLRAPGAPVVGVTATGTQGRRVLLDWYRETGASSVDDLDYTSGRLALALLLADAEPGNYGFLEEISDDGPVPPLPQETGGS